MGGRGRGVAGAGRGAAGGPASDWPRSGILADASSGPIGWRAVRSGDWVPSWRAGAGALAPAHWHAACGSTYRAVDDDRVGYVRTRGGSRTGATRAPPRAQI